MQTQNQPTPQPATKMLPEEPSSLPDNVGAAVVGNHGGTDAAAAAQLSGSKGGPGGTSLRQYADAKCSPGSPEGALQGDSISPVAGGTGLGTSATADDTRTGTGTSSRSGTALTGGGMSGARVPPSGQNG